MTRKITRFLAKKLGSRDVLYLGNAMLKEICTKDYTEMQWRFCNKKNIRLCDCNWRSTFSKEFINIASKYLGLKFIGKVKDLMK